MKNKILILGTLFVPFILQAEFFHLQQYSNGDLTSKAKMSGAKGLIPVRGNASFFAKVLFSDPLVPMIVTLIWP